MAKKKGHTPVSLDKIKSTVDIPIPRDLLDQVIGQDEAVRKVKLAVRQRRHLLLVGPPGVGKSMLAQSLAFHLSKPTEQVNVIDNPQNLNRPIVEVIKHEINERVLKPSEVPVYVAEQLGFRCPKCSTLSKPEESICPKCCTEKYKRGGRKDVMQTTSYSSTGHETGVTYQRKGDKILAMGKEQESMLKTSEQKKRYTIVPLNRKNFVHATGASETELLGDVRHDPYGSHPEIGTPAYMRVIPGAIHEAHEGVLFIDELPHLDHLQNYILTAMQERKFPIVGRNPQSAGAAVKVEDVPCNFIFVGACNIKDVQNILSPLRSRIIGNGYEILLESIIPDTKENRDFMAQFMAQEIVKDGKIPHATRDAVVAVIEEAHRRAKTVDDARDSLTMRLRDLGGVIRMAGDFAVSEKSKLIEEKHITDAIKESKPIEHQLQERYGSVLRGIERDQIISPEYGRLGISYR